MSHEIKLVQNDNRPWITLTIFDESTDEVMNLAGATAEIHFRKAGTSTVLSSLPCELVTDGSDGKIRFKFDGAALNVDPGQYEGEVEITFSDGDKQTVFDILKFRVRGQFA